MTTNVTESQPQHQAIILNTLTPLLLHPHIAELDLLRHFVGTTLKMPSESSASSRCRSAGKVASRLLLSVLALGAPALAGGNQYNKPPVNGVKTTYNQLPPIEPVFPDYGDTADLAGAERFVS